MGKEVFRYHTRDSGVTVWRLGAHEGGDFYIETFGDPSLTKEQFAEMAKRVARDATLPAPVE